MLGQMQIWTEVDITSFLHIGRKNLAVAIIGLQYQTPGEWLYPQLLPCLEYNLKENCTMLEEWFWQW